ncbi:MAG: TonB-dependent receptor [Prevotellaceae bacterium]|jgi:TonB-linked SusC/RagA family outer membrane protein|nr:TonB-dependent receptor [Prevotellaceae bacterium]
MHLHKQIKNQSRFLYLIGILGFCLLSLTPSTLQAQTVQIKGSVLDVNNESLIGANVREVGVATNGTITDIDGNFSLSIAVGAKFEITYIGFIPQTVTVTAGQTDYKIVMKEDAQSLEEVVVIGYGSQKKSDITGAVTSVNTEQMMQRAPVSLTQALQGMAAGVVVTQGGGDPTGGYSIRIRGVATMNGNTDPLWVVDGVQAGNASNLDWLDPADVKSIEILKDASSTAIYGARGANGVILVTTNSGEVGQMRVNLRADFGVSTYADKLDMASLDEWLVAYRQSIANDGKTPFTAYNGDYDNQLNVIDWQDVMAQTSFRQNYNLSISGGTKALQANASVGYMDNKGIIQNTWNKRLTLRLNVSANIKDVVRLGFSTNFNTSKNRGGGNMVNYARLIPTMDYVDKNTGELIHVPVKYPDGTTGPEGNQYGHYYYDPLVEYSAGIYTSNPYADQYIRRYQEDWDNDNGQSRNTAWIEVKLLKGLTFRSDMNYNFNGSNSWYYNSIYLDTYYAYNTSSGGANSVDEFGTNGSASTNMGVENTLTYANTWGAHNFSMMLGQSASKSHGSSNNSSTRDLSFGFLRGFYSNDPNNYNGGGGGPWDSERFSSYLARVNYSFKDRYLLTASVRRDGSSKFGKDNRWGTFPSFSLGWRASEEAFIQKLDIFSNLKVRVGWGQTGNANVNATDAISQMNASGVAFDYYNANNDYTRIQGIAQTREIDTGLKWEANEQTNIGLDLGFLRGQLNVTLDYYIRNTKDLILSKTIRPSAGFSSITTNFGSIRNQGLEFTVNYNKQINRDWFVSATLTGSTNKNKAIDVGAGTTSSGPTGSGWTNRQVSYTGLPLGTYYGYVVDHIIRDQAEIDALNARAVELYGKGMYYDYATTGPGNFLFKDLNGDGHITEDDRAYLGDGFVKLNYGLNLQARYRNWDASMYMYGVFGQKLLSWAKFYTTTIKKEDNGYFNLLSEYATNSWTPENPNAPYVKLSRDDLPQSYRVSDYFVEKADYLKISNLQVGYTFDRNFFGADVVNRARVYLSVQNLLTLSPYSKYSDPEVNAGVTTTGYDGGRYPFPRTFMFGLQVSF